MVTRSSLAQVKMIRAKIIINSFPGTAHTDLLRLRFFHTCHRRIVMAHFTEGLSFINLPMRYLFLLLALFGLSPL